MTRPPRLLWGVLIFLTLSLASCSQVRSSRLYDQANQDATETRQLLEMMVQSPGPVDPNKLAILESLLRDANERRENYFDKYLAADKEAKEAYWGMTTTTAMFTLQLILMGILVL